MPNCWWALDIYHRESTGLGTELYSRFRPRHTGEDETPQGIMTDFIGLNYYRATIAHAPPPKLAWKARRRQLQPVNRRQLASNTPTGAGPLTPTACAWLLQLHQRYGLPILISENGLGAYDKIEAGQIHDSYRIDYLQRHILACHQAIQAGVELWGYCTWSFTDLFSWLNGYAKRYGLVHVDFESGALTRTRLLLLAPAGDCQQWSHLYQERLIWKDWN